MKFKCPKCEEILEVKDGRYEVIGCKCGKIFNVIYGHIYETEPLDPVLDPMGIILVPSRRTVEPYDQE